MVNDATHVIWDANRAIYNTKKVKHCTFFINLHFAILISQFWSEADSIVLFIFSIFIYIYN